MTRTTFSRRGVLALAGASATAPSALFAQSAPVSFEAFAASCRSLSGFDTISRPLLRGLFERLDRLEAQAVASADDTLRDETAKRVLNALYTGTLPPRREDGEPQRIVYGEALMYAAVEDSLNVPSYCGGLPNFWQNPPDDAA